MFLAFKIEEKKQFNTYFQRSREKKQTYCSIQPLRSIQVLDKKINVTFVSPTETSKFFHQYNLENYSPTTSKTLKEEIIITNF